jgi:hypothetical protein
MSTLFGPFLVALSFAGGGNAHAVVLALIIERGLFLGEAHGATLDWSHLAAFPIAGLARIRALTIAFMKIGVIALNAHCTAQKHILPGAFAVAGRAHRQAFAVAHSIVVFAFFVQAHFCAFVRKSFSARPVAILVMTFGLAIVCSVRGLAFYIIRSTFSYNIKKGITRKEVL